MKETVFFLQMFSDYMPPEELKSYLDQAAVVSAQVDASARRVEITVFSEQYMPNRVLQQVSRDLMQLYGLPRLDPKECLASSGQGFTLRVTPSIWMSEPLAEVLCIIPWEKETND